MCIRDSFLAVASSVLIWVFDGQISALIPLYAFGVFTGFTLSQAGMFRRHLRLKQARWKAAAALSGFGSFTTGVIALIVVVSKFTQGAWLPAVIIPLMLVVISILVTRAIPLFRSMQVKLDRINQVMRETLAGIRVIRAFVRTRYEEERFQDANLDLLDIGLRVTRLFALMMPTLFLILNMSTVAIMYFGAHRIAGGDMPIGNLTAFIAYVMQILISVMMATMMMAMVPRAAASADRIQEVLEVEPAIVDPPAPKLLPAWRPKAAEEMVPVGGTSGNGRRGGVSHKRPANHGAGMRSREHACRGQAVGQDHRRGLAAGWGGRRQLRIRCCIRAERHSARTDRDAAVPARLPLPRAFPPDLSRAARPAGGFAARQVRQRADRRLAGIAGAAAGFLQRGRAALLYR